jgi:hypothetical protein
MGQEHSAIPVQYRHSIGDVVTVQTEELCKLAIQQNGRAFKHVKEQTEEICKLAVQQNFRTFIKENAERS